MQGIILNKVDVTVTL